MIKNKQTTKLAVEYIGTDKLIPYAVNAKLHPRPQIDQIKASIVEFGMNDPIAVDENSLVIIEGHGRLIACQELGIKEVPIIKLGHLTKIQQDAYRITHNKLTMNSDFDFKLLELELKKLQEEGIDLELTGFDEKELAEMKIGFPENDNDPDEIPDITVQGEPVIKKGDIIELGRHRLLCGDCTVKENYDALMQGKTADMVFTDPPYNVNYQYNKYDDKKTKEQYKTFCASFLKILQQYCDMIVERYCKYVNNYNIKINSIPTDWQKAKQAQIAMSAALTPPNIK